MSNTDAVRWTATPQATLSTGRVSRKHAIPSWKETRVQKSLRLVTKGLRCSVSGDAGGRLGGLCIVGGASRPSEICRGNDVDTEIIQENFHANLQNEVFGAKHVLDFNLIFPSDIGKNEME